MDDAARFERNTRERASQGLGESITDTAALHVALAVASNHRLEPLPAVAD